MAAAAPMGSPPTIISSAFSKPDEAGQPLSAAGAGQYAELHFREAALGGRNGDAVVTRERDLEPAAESRTVNRGDDRLRTGVEVFDHRAELRILRRLAELGDVRPGDERAALAGEHDRRHARRPKAARARPSSSPARTACPSAFTGGLSTVMMPTDPRFSNSTSLTRGCSASACISSSETLQVGVGVLNVIVIVERVGQVQTHLCVAAARTSFLVLRHETRTLL